MSKAWSHLPNARHIDWVLKSLKENPELWVAARHASWDATMFAAWDAAWGAVWDAVSDSTRDAVYDAARAEVWDAAPTPAPAPAWDAAGTKAWDAARATILALIAYDDCDQFLSMSYKRLKVWAVLSEDSRAVLLLPMVYVREKLLQEVAV